MWPDFPDRRIESQTCKMTRAILPRHTKSISMPADEMSEISVRNLHSLGNSRRPGGVDHIGKALRLDELGHFGFRRGCSGWRPGGLRSITTRIDAPRFHLQSI